MRTKEIYQALWGYIANKTYRARLALFTRV